MISKGENRKAKSEEQLWHYLAVKKQSALLREITSKHYGDFYSLNCLHSFPTNKKHESHQKVFEIKDFCNILYLLNTKKY